MTTTTQYGVRCQVSGGVTGFREGWLKGADGQIATFPTLAEAHAAAEALAHKASAKVSPQSQCSFVYRAQARGG